MDRKLDAINLLLKDIDDAMDNESIITKHTLEDKQRQLRQAMTSTKGMRPNSKYAENVLNNMRRAYEDISYKLESGDNTLASDHFGRSEYASDRYHSDNKREMYGGERQRHEMYGGAKKTKKSDHGKMHGGRLEEQDEISVRIPHSRSMKSDKDLIRDIVERKNYVAYFYLPTCKYCPRTTEMLKDIPESNIIRIDVQQYPDAAKKYGVSAVPSIMKNGELVSAAGMTKHQLLELLAK